MNTLTFYDGKKLNEEKKRNKSKTACDDRELKIFGDPPNGNIGCQVLSRWYKFRKIFA